MCVIEYLGEIETEFDNTLACLSGAQMGSKLRIMKKTGGRKSRYTLPLRHHRENIYKIITPVLLLVLFSFSGKLSVRI